MVKMLHNTLHSPRLLMLSVVVGCRCYKVKLSVFRLIYVPAINIVEIILI